MGVASTGGQHLYVAGDSIVHRMAPEAKIVAAVVFVVTVALTPRHAPAVSAAEGAVLMAAVSAAGVPLRRWAARLLVVLPFVAFAILVPFVAEGEQVQVEGLSLSEEGLWGAWNIVSKALLGAGASILLAATTTRANLLRGLSRLRVPPVLVSITAVMFRYFDLIASEFLRARTAMIARGHDPRWLWQARPIASCAGVLFVRAYERGERVHLAMCARGFTGTIPDLDRRRTSTRDWVMAALPATVTAGALVASLMIR